MLINISRNKNIDFIRGLAIISVILLHVHIRIPFNQGWFENVLPQKLVNIMFYSGYYGVISFFVVSGFLITSTSLKRWSTLPNLKLSQFYGLRFARIAPCLIGLIIILSVLHIVGVKGFVITNTSLPQVIYSALSFQINWLEAQVGYLPASWDVLWSLSVEEAFYLCFPLACIFIRNDKIFKIMLLVFIILGPFARCTFSNNEMWSDHSYLSCIDGIAMGCLAALFANKMTLNRKLQKTIFSIGLFIFLFVFILRKQVAMLGLSEIGLNVTLLEAGMALILIGLHQHSTLPRSKGFFLSDPIIWFGKNSYEIYLTHSFVVLFATQLFKHFLSPINMIVPFYIAILTLSGVLGHLVAKYYSNPMNMFLKKYSFNFDLSLSKKRNTQTVNESG